MRSFKRLLTGGILMTIWSVSASTQQLTLSGEVGFSQTGSTFNDACQRLRDNEIVGLTLPSQDAKRRKPNCTKERLSSRQAI